MDNLDPSLELLNSVAERTLNSGILAEQVHPDTNAAQGARVEKPSGKLKFRTDHRTRRNHDPLCFSRRYRRDQNQAELV